MKRKSLVLFFALAFVSQNHNLSAAMTEFFGSSTNGNASTDGDQPKGGQKSSIDATAQSRDPITGRFIPKDSAVGTSGGANPLQPSGPLVPGYNPAMDNHTKAPVASAGTGLFGLPVKQVEDALRYHGAKNHSYAFGKYSRMVLSAYLITIYFDRERKVGGFSIEPREPFKTVEPGAREYFMQTFLKGADLSKFSITVASNLLEVKYVP